MCTSHLFARWRHGTVTPSILLENYDLLESLSHANTHTFSVHCVTLWFYRINPYWFGYNLWKAGLMSTSFSELVCVVYMVDLNQCCCWCCYCCCCCCIVSFKLWTRSSPRCHKWLTWNNLQLHDVLAFNTHTRARARAHTYTHVNIQKGRRYSFIYDCLVLSICSHNKFVIFQ